MTITTFLSRMAIAGAFISIFALSMPTPAEANWLSHTWHKAKHAAHHASNTIKHGAKKAGRKASNAAKKTGSAIKHGAKETGNAIEHGVEAGIKGMNDLSKMISTITHNCEEALDKWGKPLKNSMPPIVVRAVPELAAAPCVSG
jgi:hypothetical protein